MQIRSGWARQREMHMSSAHAPKPRGAASTAGGRPLAPLSTRRVANLFYMSERSGGVPCLASKAENESADNPKANIRTVFH